MDDLTAEDRAAIEAVVADFFAAFRNTGGRRPAAEPLRRLFLADARVIRHGGAAVDSWSVDDFIAPRIALLTGGRLVDFEEHEISSSTDGAGAIAQRLARYRKRGLLDGADYSGGGTKLFHLVRTADGWRIAALTWQDDPS